jgi:hypothetical protein
MILFLLPALLFDVSVAVADDPTVRQQLDSLRAETAGIANEVERLKADAPVPRTLTSLRAAGTMRGSLRRTTTYEQPPTGQTGGGHRDCGAAQAALAA